MGRLDEMFEENKKRNKQRLEAKDRNLDIFKGNKPKYKVVDKRYKKSLFPIKKIEVPIKDDYYPELDYFPRVKIKDLEKWKELFDKLLYYAPYRKFYGFGSYPKVSFSNALNIELNDRIMEIIRFAEKNDKTFKFNPSSYQVSFERSEDDGKRITNLALRGLFTEASFVKAFFIREGTQIIPLSAHLSNVYWSESIEDLVTYMETHLPMNYVKGYIK